MVEGGRGSLEPALPSCPLLELRLETTRLSPVGHAPPRAPAEYKVRCARTGLSSEPVTGGGERSCRDLTDMSSAHLTALEASFLRERRR